MIPRLFPPNTRFFVLSDEFLALFFFSFLLFFAVGFLWFSWVSVLLPTPTWGKQEIIQINLFFQTLLSYPFQWSFFSSLFNKAWWDLLNSLTGASVLESSFPWYLLSFILLPVLPVTWGLFLNFYCFFVNFPVYFSSLSALLCLLLRLRRMVS